MLPFPIDELAAYGFWALRPSYADMERAVGQHKPRHCLPGPRWRTACPPSRRANSALGLFMQFLLFPIGIGIRHR